MENNIDMNYKDLLIFFIKILLPISLIVFFLLKSTIHVIITSNIDNKDVEEEHSKKMIKDYEIDYKIEKSDKYYNCYKVDIAVRHKDKEVKLNSYVVKS